MPRTYLRILGGEDRLMLDTGTPSTTRS